VVSQSGAFAAIDFETADYGRDSACAVGIVRVENDRIVERAYRLVRPPRQEFVFTYLHGITWEMVRSEPAFGQLWPELKRLLRDLDFLAAHNASFDRGVLEACCRQAGLPVPRLPFQCTVRLAREVFGVYPTKLPDVCRALRLKLDQHHHAQADAEACARIVLAARKAVSRRAG
jgi:DNA polymerase-3 subunit epsilon